MKLIQQDNKNSLHMKEQQDNWRKTRSPKEYRKFIAQFKTKPCQISEQHFIEYCQFYHYVFKQKRIQCSEQEYQSPTELNIAYLDRRRSPYGKLNQFVYSQKMCEKSQQECILQTCKNCHNFWEYNYHPDIFKTEPCENFYECQYEYCYKLHCFDYIINHKTQTTSPGFSEFFRFNLDTFKTQPCNKEYPHEKSFCLFYHSSKDYRRPNFQEYQHTECPSLKNQKCTSMECSYSHNKIQQLYHPRRYKSKFCQKHYISRKSSLTPNDQSSFKSLCPFNKLCSFAHNDEQITVNLIDKAPRNLEFYLYMYKTVWCPITTDHNRSVCVYAHNIQDFRRNPKQKYYEPVQCPFWKKNQNIKSIEDAGCPNGLECDKCHGWKQKQYHPIIYCKIKSGQIEISDEGKSKTDSDVKKDQSEFSHALVSKKLQSVNKKTNIQKIVQQQLSKGNNQKKQQQLCLPGTPFFKNNRSQVPKKFQSERGDSVTKQETDDKASQMEERGSMITTKSMAMKSGIFDQNINSNSDTMGDEELFRVFSGYQEQPKNKISLANESTQSFLVKTSEKLPEKSTRTVSRSLGCQRDKSHNFYSKDICEILNPKIVSILQQKKISEIKLINMNQKQINNINGLSGSQKNLIIKKIISARDALKKSPTYQESLVKFFIRHKKDKILSKMKTKKVKQEKLLLLDSQIAELSFLTQSQKKQLPELLRKLTNNRDFESINQDIAKTIKCRDSNDFQ